MAALLRQGGAPQARLLTELKLQAPSEVQQELQGLYEEARACLEAAEREAQAESAGAEEGQWAQQADGPVQGALMYLARLVYQAISQPPASGAWLPLSAIANAAGTNPFDVFREWPVVAGKLAGSFLERRGLTPRRLEALGSISEWQKTLVAIALLSKKYKDLFHKYLDGLPEHKALAMRLGWMLYIVLKAKLLPKFPDLITCMELLVCVLNVLVAHLNQLPPEIPRGPNGEVQLLEAISDALRADRSHVQALMRSVDPLVTTQLAASCKEWLVLGGERPAHPGAPFIRTSCSYLPGLLADGPRMKAIADALDREYSAHYTRHGEVDERDILHTDFSTFASPRVTPGAVYRAGPPGHGLPMHPATADHHNHQGHYRAAGAGVSGLVAAQRLGPGSFVSVPVAAGGGGASPGGWVAGSALPPGLVSPMPLAQLGPSTATPITEALGSVAWLRAVTASLKAEPSPALLKYCAMCVPNPASTMAKRVWEMAEAVLPNEVSLPSAFPLAQPSMSGYRREEAIKLYFHVLELVLGSEERLAAAAAGKGAATTAGAGPSGGSSSSGPSSSGGLGTSFTTLLTSSKLHKGIMACSLELVMASYRIVSCPFPRILDIIRLHAFDLIKIVQTYVRHMPGMPLELKRHLYLMEEKTVESLAWAPGSSLYPVILTAMGSTGATSGCTPGGGSTTPRGSGGGGGCNHGLMSPTPGAPPPVGAPQRGGDGEQGPRPMEVVPPLAVPGAGGSNGHGDGTSAATGGHVQPPSPSKRQAPGSHAMASPLKKARASDNGAVPTQLSCGLTDPLPLAVGRPPGPAAMAGLHTETAAALTWLHDFLRKVMKLAWFRLGFLCQALSFGPHDPAAVRARVYDCVEHAVYHHTHLLYNRHLDQMLLCALYGYCKVQHIGSITFKDIIAQYRRQPQASQAVFRAVVIQQTNPDLLATVKGDIIAFYNKAFVPHMKTFLLKGEGGGSGGGAGSTVGYQHPAMGLPPIPPGRGAGSSPRLPGPGLGLAAGASPSPHGGGPAGRPPLPPTPCDAVAVNATIKQTIHGFFPPMQRAASGGSAGRPTPPGALLGLAAPGPAAHRPTAGPTASVVLPPRWGAAGGANSGGILATVSVSNGGAPLAATAPRHAPVAAPSAQLHPAPLEPPSAIPNGIATLLRALDAADAGALDNDGDANSPEEGAGRDGPGDRSDIAGGAPLPPQHPRLEVAVPAAGMVGGGVGGGGVLSPDEPSNVSSAGASIVAPGLVGP